MRYKLEDLIDMEQFQSMQDRLSEIYPFPSAIIDNEGVILTATAWQDVCTKFHRQNEECEKDCIKSDLYILEHLAEADPAVSYRCPHGLVDNAMPIFVDGEHLGNFFTGQFFLEEPDLEFFREQARKYGFDEDAYLQAVQRVPIWGQEQLKSFLLFIKEMIGVLSTVGLNRLKQIEADRALKQSERRYRSLFEQAGDYILVLEVSEEDDLVVVDANQAACKIHGYAHEEFIGMSVRELDVALSEERVRAVLSRVMSGESVLFETAHRKKDGTTFPVEVRTSLLDTGEGPPLITSVERDITARKRAEEAHSKLEAQLTQAQKLESVGRLAGGVAHDFNNMLSVILGYTDMALSGMDPSDPLYHAFTEIEQAGNRSAELTRQLLTFARKQIVAPKVLDLNEVSQRMLTMLRRLIGEDIDLVWMPGADIWPVSVDPAQVDQMLANLCVNARDAISGVGKVTIETGSVTFDEDAVAAQPDLRSGDFVMLAVSDDGCGMDDDTKEHLFEPFFTTKAVGEGTGLGLATVYGIAKQNGGFVTVESEVGEGTTFTIYLPRHVGDAEQTAGSEPDARPRGQGEAVLMVEDEATVLKVGSAMLKELGYTVLTAGTPGEALALMASHAGKIDLLMTDVVMPEMNGRELAEQLQMQSPGLRCLFVSGYTADVILYRGLLNEDVQFLQKPFTASRLAVAVRKALGVG